MGVYSLPFFLLIITQVAFLKMCMDLGHRSRAHAYVIKAITLFLRGNHATAKTYDALHVFGISMSQRWTHRTVTSLARQSMSTVKELVQEHAWSVSSDNINFNFTVQEQRAHNKDHFESGVATTIYVHPYSRIKHICPESLRVRRVLGANNPLTWDDIQVLEARGAAAIHKMHVQLVLQVLFHSEAFEFKSYAERSNTKLAVPSPVRQAPRNRTNQFILPTRNQEVASYDGNAAAFDNTITDILLDGDPSDKERRKEVAKRTVVVFCGDQLTAQRLRDVQKQRAGEFNSFDRMDYAQFIFALFHLRMAFAISIHNQYYSTTTGFGLCHIFHLLDRKHLAVPSTQGTFFHKFDDALSQVFQGLIRSLWLKVGHVKDISELRNRSASDLYTMAHRIIDDYASNRALRKEPANGDAVVRRNTIQMTRDLLDYILLDDVCKLGDVGMILHLFPRLLARFVGGSSTNYSKEVVEFLQGAEREWPTELR
jgi:hypothetical protein